MVSIIMATHNPKPEYFHKAIKSLCSQTFKDIELIVVDDGSDSIEVERLVEDCQPSIKYYIIHTNTRIGLANALNLGIEKSHGEIIARLDDDDLSAPDRIKQQVAFLQSHDSVVCVFTGVQILNKEGKKLSKIIHQLNSPRKIRYYLEVKGNPFCHSSAMFYRRVFNEAGKYNPKFIYAQDYDLWIRFLSQGNLYYIPEVLTYWRYLEGEKSIQKEALQTGFCEAARYDNYLRGKKDFISTLKFLLSMIYSAIQILLLKSKQNLSK